MDDEFGGGEEVGIAGVFGVEKGPAAFLEETFEGRFAVDEGGDDLPRGRFARGEEDDIVFEDVGSNHGVAAHPQTEDATITTEAERRGVDCDGFVGLEILGVGGGKAGGDDAEYRNGEEREFGRLIR